MSSSVVTPVRASFSPVTFAPFAASGAELDVIFAGAPAGDLPVGFGTGTAIFASGVAGRMLAAFTRLVAWRGKVFSPSGESLRNVLSPFGVRAIRAEVRHDLSNLDGRECVLLDYSRTSLVAKPIRDEIREVAPGVYLGIVFAFGHKLPLRFVLDFNR